MNQQLAPFDFEGRQVRIVTDAQGEPWFVAADVLSTISLDRKALERLDDDEKGVNSIHAPGGVQEMTTVNEPGLYALVLGSRKAEAKRFKRWVTHEVLPAIRKTGSYAVPAIAALPVALRPSVKIRVAELSDVSNPATAAPVTTASAPARARNSSKSIICNLPRCTENCGQ